MVDQLTPPTPPDELKIQTFGRFSVWLGEERLPDSAWGREKARKLLQYFVTYRGRVTVKERIVAALWPELDAKRADRDFKVALNGLASALEPDRPPRAPSGYISRQGSGYALNPEAGIDIDVVEFEAGISAGSAAETHFLDQAIELYRRALQLYQGEYLPDAIYEDWSSAERERLAAIYLSGAGRLARLLLAAGAPVESIMWSQKVIAIDACWEEAYRLLMEAHMATGNRPLALRTYEQCRQKLDEELNVPPMDETTRLYEKIWAS